MTGYDVIDATDLFSSVQNGIATEDFSTAKEWISKNIEPMFAINSEKILEIKNTKINQSYYWGKKDLNEFNTILTKLEDLYKKRNRPTR